MARMIDLIRQAAVPASLMRSAARGALSLPPAEMLEILVLLAPHPVFGEQAQLTLAGWDEAAVIDVVRDPQAPPAVLTYLSDPANLRPPLLPALLENPGVPESRLAELALRASAPQLPVFAASTRVCSCPEVVRILLQNPELTETDRERLQPCGTGQETAAVSAAEGEPDAVSSAKNPESEDLLDLGLREYLQEHDKEIKEEGEKPFQLVDSTAEERAEIEGAQQEPAPKGVSLAGAAARAMDLALSGGSRERISPVQKIARMGVGDRVKLAYVGSRDERFILIRDAARVVSSAVLESPKLTDAEVETFAALKTVGENVLRVIASKRKFKRINALKRILTNNPRCPTEIALPMVKELQLPELKSLMTNKNVSDTVRNYALKTYRDKSTSRR